MYAFILKAKIKRLDKQYGEITALIKRLAIEKYGCIDYIHCRDKHKEIVISYWPSLTQIEAWQNDPRNHLAQQLGREKWYDSYEMETVKRIKAYKSNWLNKTVSSV